MADSRVGRRGVMKGIGAAAALGALGLPGRAAAGIRLLVPLVFKWRILAGHRPRAVWTYTYEKDERVNGRETRIAETRAIEMEWAPIRSGKKRTLVALDTAGDARMRLTKVRWTREDPRGVVEFAWASVGNSDHTDRQVSPVAPQHAAELSALANTLEESVGANYRARLRSFGTSSLVRDGGGFNPFNPGRHVHLPLRRAGYRGGERFTPQLADFGTHHTLFSHPSGGERAFEMHGVATIKRIDDAHALELFSKAKLTWRTSKASVDAAFSCSTRFLREGRLAHTAVDWARAYDRGRDTERVRARSDLRLLDPA